MNKNTYPTNYPLSSGFADTKRHYTTLDGLRGIAAILVVLFHVFEAHAHSRYEQLINHGYLAVDFFFVLSGFVVSYAYDDRWSQMTKLGFFKRRLIRLHPMIVISMVIGASFFYSQAGEMFPLIAETPLWKVLLIMIIGMIMIPVPPSLDIRGWSEMYPLNGPTWSLFFEYIANILYAIFIRNLSNTILVFLIFIAGYATINLAVFGPNRDVIGGWSLESEQLYIGITRLMYPFLAGILLSRIIKRPNLKGAFYWCAIFLITTLSMPRLGGQSATWLNGIYDAFCIIIVFPLIVFMGTSSVEGSLITTRVSNFLGEISYPLYIVHYPFVYAYMSWVTDYQPAVVEAVPVALLTILTCLIIAYLCSRYYDIPIRSWLSTRKQRPKSESSVSTA